MRFACVSVALLASSVVCAETPIDGWYSTLFGGYAYVPNNINKTYLGVTRTNASYKAGFDAGGSLGFKSNPMRYEGELSFIQANLRKFNLDAVAQTGIRGYSEAALAMANVYYDFPNLLNAIQPFLGLGIGYAWVKAELKASGPLAVTQFSGSNSVFAYQGKAGLTYNFSENYALNIGYRYVATLRVTQLGKAFQASTANVGVIYRFNEARYK